MKCPLIEFRYFLEIAEGLRNYSAALVDEWKQNLAFIIELGLRKPGNGKEILKQLTVFVLLLYNI